MPLTDTHIKQAKPGNKDQWLTDGHGLRLLIKSSDARYWRL
ncbi:integrase arm-type DNA-binding domain-containing protein [Microbulbifer spongiae]